MVIEMTDPDTNTADDSASLIAAIRRDHDEKMIYSGTTVGILLAALDERDDRDDRDALRGEAESAARLKAALERAPEPSAFDPHPLNTYDDWYEETRELV